jgi:hypothetical protein
MCVCIHVCMAMSIHTWTRMLNVTMKSADRFEGQSSGKGAVFQHVCYRCQHACSSSQHEILTKSHVNIMSNLTTCSKLEHDISKLQHGVSKIEHGVSKLEHACYRCYRWDMHVTDVNMHVTDVNMINTSLFAPQKKSPHRLHHLLGYARLPSPQTSWAYPAWPRTTDSDKARLAACAARSWRATQCDSPARAARQP